MSIATNIALKGQVEIQVHRRGGELVERLVINNKIVDYGLDLLSRYLVSHKINDTEFATGKNTSPVRAIAVGTGTGGPFGVQATALVDEELRNPIESVELLRGTVDIPGTSGSSTNLVRLTSKIPGAYGNRLQAVTPAPPGDGSYQVEIRDSNDPYWDGTAYQPNTSPPRSTTYTAETLAELATTVSGDPVVSAFAPAPTSVDQPQAGTRDLAGGGTGVIVQATFSSATTLALTEAGLFTSETPGAPLMFNAVTFAPINLTSDLDITFRWKILFQESSGS